MRHSNGESLNTLWYSLNVPWLSLDQIALGRSFHHWGTTNEESWLPALAVERRRRQQMFFKGSSQVLLDLDTVHCTKCMETINSFWMLTDSYLNSVWRVCVVCSCVPECQWIIGVTEPLPWALLHDIDCSSKRWEESQSFLSYGKVLASMLFA